jgi:hypothetical protein
MIEFLRSTGVAGWLDSLFAGVEPRLAMQPGKPVQVQVE